jgi:hypothetical protein
MNKTKLTSVKVMKEFYSSFRIMCVDSKMTLQKLTNRALHLYTNDPDFKNIIDDTTVSGSQF